MFWSGGEMFKFDVFVIFLIFCDVLFSNRCSAILVAEQQQNKPTYTSGIKTANWKKSILTHQNYSRVNVHNDPDAQAQYVITQTQETQRIYPVYNAHAPEPGIHQGILETKSHTDIDTSEFPRPNRTIFKRKIEYKSMEIYEKCPSGVTGQFVYISSCNQYLNCWKGRGVVQNCAPGTLFNPKTLECDFPDKVDCITGPRQTTYSSLRVAKSIQQANCPEGFSGLIPNYTDCSKFISCSNGQPFPMDCPPGTLFDMNQNICDHAKKCTCFNGQSGADFTIQVGHLGSLPGGQQNRGQYHQTIHRQTNDCQDLGNNCRQNSQAHSQFESSSGRVYSFSNHNPTKSTVASTHGQSICNPQYQNCGQQTGQTQGRFHGQSGGYGQLNPNSGYVQTTSVIHTNFNPSRGQGISYGQTDRRNYVSNGQALVQTVDSTQCKSQGQSCVQNTGHNILTEPKCDPSLQNCIQGPSRSQNSHIGGYEQSNTQPFGVGRNCNPFLQNCGGIGEQGYGATSDRTVSYIYGTAQKCNPSTQNCGQGQESSSSKTQIYTPSQNCDPSIRNCPSTRQEHGGQNTIQTSSHNNCDPSTQHCRDLQGSGIQTFVQTHSYGQNCNPLLQNCNQNIGQAIPTFSQTSQIQQQTGAVQVNCDLSAPNCGRSNIQPFGVGRNCNPFLQNCGGIGEQGYGSTSDRTVSYNYDTAQKCNPSTQNCGQGQESSSSKTQIYTPSQNCDPSIRNCPSTRQEHGGQNTIQTSSHNNCDPSTQNCRYLQGSGIQTFVQNHSYGQNCNPVLQNCNQNIGQAIPTFSQTSQIQQQTGAVQVNCDLSAPNCGQSSGNEQIRYNGHISSQNPSNVNSGSRNYNAICNINDSNCRRSHTIVTRRITPKCPDDFQGLTKHPYDCKKFLSCANGGTFIRDCAPGTLFNPSSGSCDFPYNVDCQISEGESIDSETSYGVNWNREYEGNVQEVRPDDTYTTKKPDDTIRGGTGTWGNANIQNTITETSNGEIGLVSRPIYQTTTEKNRKNENSNKNSGRFPDYVDVFDPKEQLTKGYYSTTPRSVWPPPFPKDVTEADYVFDYEDGESVTLDPDDIFYASEKKGSGCDDDDFHCSSDFCISQTMVCDGHRDCGNGKDELLCEEYIARFSVTKNAQLVVLEKQRWVNASYATCAVLCIQNTKFNCRSFNYRKIDRTCFLSDQNVGLTGALRKYIPTDYYELKTGTVDCSDHSKYFECSNKKCLMKEQVCDGADDCGDRQDEKNCKSEDFGYSIKLAGSKERNEGRIEVTAFGKTGYICDDQFGIQDANVVCKELGFQLGAAEVRGQSYFAKDLNESNTLYMMDEVDCIGNETTLLNCGFSGWGVHDCKDQEIAGVVCKTPQEKCGAGFWRCDTGNECVPYAFVCDGVNDCSDDSDERNEYCEAPTEIRLVNGSRSSEGRLEIKHHGIWGTICDDDFNEDAAKVVCKFFGYRGKSSVKKDAHFGKGDGPIWLDQVSCLGNETELEKCTRWNWGEHNCEHDEDVGVICSDEMIEVEVQRSAKLPIRHEAGLPKNCGFRKDNQFLENDLIHARVVSGSVARKGDYPWQAALKVKVKETSAHWCGAVIISSKWVLTAAHCLQGYTKGAYVIVAGEYNTDEVEGTEQQKYIEEFFIHERFRKGHKMNNDIALIKVKGGGFELNDDVQPICLPDTEVSYDQDLNCTISGFGSVKSGISVPSHNMMAAWIPIHSNEICKMPHIYGSALAEGMFCAGFLDGGVDACDGDSGGPLACLDQGYFTLYGLTSWGQHCGYANKPGVYVKVSYYRPWIEDIIQRHS